MGSVEDLCVRACAPGITPGEAPQPCCAPRVRNAGTRAFDCDTLGVLSPGRKPEIRQAAQHAPEDICIHIAAPPWNAYDDCGMDF